MQTFFALGALCGFGSLFWLMVLKHQTTGQQLTLSTARALAGGLDVLVQYKPGRARVGLRARVRLIEPAGARCWPASGANAATDTGSTPFPNRSWKSGARPSTSPCAT